MKKIATLLTPVVNWFKPKETEMKEAPRFEEWYHKLNPRDEVPNAEEFFQVMHDFKFNKKSQLN